eukprot:gene18000-biopygen1744
MMPPGPQRRGHRDTTARECCEDMMTPTLGPGEPHAGTGMPEQGMREATIAGSAASPEIIPALDRDEGGVGVPITFAANAGSRSPNAGGHQGCNSTTVGRKQEPLGTPRVAFPALPSLPRVMLSQ